jgi:hypothetical protein
MADMQNFVICLSNDFRSLLDLSALLLGSIYVEARRSATRHQQHNSAIFLLGNRQESDSGS